MPDPIIDRDAIIEKAKIHIYNKVEDADWGNAYDAAAAALPCIADDLLAPIEALHPMKKAVYQRRDAQGDDHWDEVHFCRGCSADWPCPTAQAIADIRTTSQPSSGPESTTPYPSA